MLIFVSLVHKRGLCYQPGWVLFCVSEKALSYSTQSNLPKTFFAWQDQIKTNDLGYFPLYATNESVAWPA